MSQRLITRWEHKAVCEEREIYDINNKPLNQLQLIVWRPQLFIANSDVC